MTTKLVRQAMFSTGEVDEQVWKRTDATEIYMTAAQSLLNCEVGTTGLAKKRRGTKYKQTVTGMAEPNSRMYDFVDKYDNHYIIMSAGNKFYIFNVPSQHAQVVTAAPLDVITGRGTSVVANDDNITLLQILFSPYTSAELGNLDYTQDGDTLIITHADHKPAKIYIDYTSGITFNIADIDIYPQPAYDFNLINYNDDSVTLDTVSFPGFVVLTLSPGTPLFTDAWIDGQIIGGGVDSNEPIGYAIIKEVAYTGVSSTFKARIQIPFKVPGATQGTQYSIKQAAWSNALGWPSKVLFYQNRLWLANTKSLPNTIFGSKINSPINYDVGTGRDTDAIIYTIGQTDSGNIRWLNGGKQLEIFTEYYEFACPQDTNTALTPNTFSIRQQSSYGSSPFLKPLTYINDSYFVAKTGKAILNFHFSGIGLAYVTGNISAASSHLVGNPSNRAILRGSDTTQDNFIYFLNQGNNTITSFQFSAEYKLAALTPIKFQTDITLVDIVTSNNAVYLLKHYTKTGAYIIEQFTNDTKVDSSRALPMAASGYIENLSELAGYTVQVVVGNQDYGQYLVNNTGTITVNNLAGVGNTAIVGLLYDVKITPMYFFAEANESAIMKTLTRIYVDYVESLNFYINDILVPYQSFADIQADRPLVPRTDTAIVAPVKGSARFDTLSITQSSPFDLIITSIAYQISSSVI